jgi:nucleoside-diphosphate-sugar epimerase
LAKILVTGATGAIGGWVVSALVAAGHDVRGTYRSAPGPNPKVEWIRADLTQNGGYESLLSNCHGVIHLAAEIREPTSMDAINVDATCRLVAHAATHGVRYFGHTSSVVVYGSPLRRRVDENSPRIDPCTSIVDQYHAEPSMRQYARTKAAAEIAIESLNAPMVIDLYRPAVVIENRDILGARKWSNARKIFAGYRRTQFITMVDAAATIVHLMDRGLGAVDRMRHAVEAYNLVDPRVVDYKAILASAYEATGNPQFKISINLPIVMDFAKDFLRYRKLTIRYPLGMLEIPADKLLATGFKFPVGIDRALSEAIRDFEATGS